MSGVVPVDVKYSDNVGVVRAELYVNGTKIVTDSMSPFAFAWDTSTYGDGSYSLVVKAFDAAGNVGTSPAVSVTLGNDAVAPTISGLNLTDGMTVSSNQPISASASDNQTVAKMSLYIDGREVATTTGSSIAYTWNTRKVSSGQHTVMVRAWDAAGLSVTRSVSVLVGGNTDSGSTTVTGKGRKK